MSPVELDYIRYRRANIDLGIEHPEISWAQWRGAGSEVRAAAIERLERQVRESSTACSTP